LNESGCGGVELFNVSKVSVKNAVFSNLSGKKDGALSITFQSIPLADSAVTIEDCLFEKCRGSKGGGIYCELFFIDATSLYPSLSIIRSNFTQNEGIDMGGALYLTINGGEKDLLPRVDADEITHRIENCRFISNWCGKQPSPPSLGEESFAATFPCGGGVSVVGPGHSLSIAKEEEEEENVYHQMIKGSQSEKNRGGGIVAKEGGEGVDRRNYIRCQHSLSFFFCSS
jgi:hypothetical protein